MWCGGVWHRGTNILVEPGISIFRVRRKELSYPEEGGQQVPPNCLSLSTKPHGVRSRDFILNKLKSPLHITCLGLIYMSTRVVKLRTEFLKRYAVSFSLHKTYGDVPLWTCPEILAVACLCDTLTGSVYKWCWHLLRKWNSSLLKYIKWMCSTILHQIPNKLSCSSAVLCHKIF